MRIAQRDVPTWCAWRDVMQAGDADRQALGVGMYVQRDVGVWV